MPARSSACRLRGPRQPGFAVLLGGVGLIATGVLALRQALQAT